MPFTVRRFPPALILLAVVVSALLLALVQAPAAPAATGRVTNGSTVTPATYAARWTAIAALVSTGENDARLGQFCGGTFVSATEVVTAAHCVFDDTDVITFYDGQRVSYYNFTSAEPAKDLQVLGGRRVLSDTNGVRLDVSHVLINPRYDPRTSRYDSAVIVLKNPVPTGSGITFMPPIEAGSDAAWGAGGGLATGANGPFIAGWGYRWMPNLSSLFTGANHTPTHRPSNPKVPTATSNARTGTAAKAARTGKSSRSVANGLEEAALPIVSDRACDVGGAGAGLGYGRDFDPNTMTCAGSLDTSDANDDGAVTNGVDSCYGDSGGPL
ncbi:MAG: trypsin-like serine protease, partial [Thermoleophilia bacterium]|nr:trypsin-like serine protease [Thermoleophilia bacterium]